ncbi:iron complex transport system substrate-binding protein [Microbacterium resistens]|uniref:Iron complex transport system substrate-binding protein n=1 Tax=Microbacterium resistens TaxID=156977 RepID=A0ABU1SAK2_9MICO|nr:ABC transporter substrate-binding protein [Microbacterium resistens]MDR6866630.1 iron complex transport system substrate-binding protein [Microbacterium resistens]
MRRWLAVVAILAVGLLSACSAPDPSAGPSATVDASASTAALTDLVPVADPRAWEGPSTALMPDTDITPVVESPAQALPVTVVSHDAAGPGDVVVSDASRVIAMDRAGSLAATVWGLGLGGLLVGRDASTSFPGTEALPVVTGPGHTVNSESIIALAPTLVITDGSIGPRDVVEQLRDVGITVVTVTNTPSFSGAEQLARDVAAVLGVPAAGETLASSIAADIALATAEVTGVAPTTPDARVRMLFLYVRGSAGVYYLFGEESGADALIAALGGIDVAGELGWQGMRPMTDEAMAAADPDLILVMTHGIESAGGVDGLLEQKPAIALTAAGEHRRFVDMDDAQVLSFGPRSGDVLRALARAVYAPDGRVRAGSGG